MRAIFLIALRELRRNVRSVKGILLLVLSALGATGMGLVLAYVRRMEENKLGELMLQQMQEQAMAQLFGSEEMGKYLRDVPNVLFVTFVFSVWVTPLLVALLGFDGVSGDIQYRSVRYWAVRARRSSFYLGKALGTWATVSVLLLVLYALVTTITLVGTHASPGSVFRWSAQLYLSVIPIAGVWTSIGVLIGSFFRVPILSLLTISATFFVLWLAKIVGLVSDSMSWLVYAYPNSYDAFLLSPSPSRIAIGLGACLGAAAALGTGGAFLLEKRDV